MSAMRNGPGVRPNHTASASAVGGFPLPCFGTSKGFGFANFVDFFFFAVVFFFANDFDFVFFAKVFGFANASVVTTRLTRRRLRHLLSAAPTVCRSDRVAGRRGAPGYFVHVVLSSALALARLRRR